MISTSVLSMKKALCMPSVRYASSSSNVVQRVVPWQAADRCKDLIGPRTVIVSMNDDKSKELAQRMWFEMQRCGVQSTFVTTNTPYPTLANLQESISLFRRTGAKSIITIGNGAVSDYGKAMRGAIETALPMNQFYKNKQIHYNQREKISLLSFGSTPSIVHYLPSFQVLHPEDDILVSGLGRPAEVVGFDSSLSILSQYQDIQIEKAYLASSLFDAIFSVAYHQLKEGKDTVATSNFVDNILKELQISVASLSSEFNLSSHSTNNVLENESKFLNVVQKIASFRNYVQHQVIKQDVNCWPGLLEITSMLASMNPKQEQLLPFSFQSTKAFQQLLQKIIPGRDQYYRQDDLKIVDALLIAKSYAGSLLMDSNNEDGLLNATKVANDAVVSQIKKYPKLFTKKLKDNNNESLTAAGHLEKIMIPLDMEIDQNGGNLVGCELKKSLLQGDVMVDLVEQVIR